MVMRRMEEGPSYNHHLSHPFLPCRLGQTNPPGPSLHVCGEHSLCGPSGVPSE